MRHPPHPVGGQSTQPLRPQYWFAVQRNLQVPPTHPQQLPVGQHWEPQALVPGQQKPPTHTDPDAQHCPLQRRLFGHFATHLPATQSWVSAQQHRAPPEPSTVPWVQHT